MTFSRQTHNQLLQGRDDLISGFAQRRGFNGAGVAYRVRDGETTDEPVVVVFVTKKRPPGLLLEEDLLPRQVNVGGVNHGVDVFEAGPFVLGGTTTFDPTVEATLTKKYRPLRQGGQISNIGMQGYGTLGAIVRDLTDNSPSILSNNHVLVLNNSSTSVGQAITQPYTGSPADTVARVTRFVPYTFGVTRPNLTDAALAKLTDDQAKEITDAVAEDLMAPYSVDHPCVGLFFAADPTNFYGVSAKIDNTLEALGADLLTPEAIYVPGPPDLGAPVEKVGARTGYASSRIHAINMKFPVFLEINGGSRIGWFTDLVGTTRFGWPGDSGSTVRLGGDGETRLPIDLGLSKCEATSAVASMYDLPLENDIPLADRIRDQFMAASTTGSFLTQLFYLNNSVILDRTQGVEASDSEKAGAASMYDKYRDFIDSALAAPDRPGLVVTRENIDDAALGLASLQTRMTTEETDATNEIFTSLVRQTEGMNHQQLVAFMNRTDVFDKVWDTTAAVPTIRALGSLYPAHRPR
ncbi:hypothetical protein FHX82_004900 [Amycolatopsis bartoniae]|uniref:Uncharacterized protein n=1 Tax=Amycolatopsis bartoniae TaxID=941986 RepID=A0A8H9IP85_9PSEU|nr:hypothetical protein [Amycolatopsis bartoniae]MBB2937824.1 hypothetical protein [Amycolatopsis bartoniae]TVT06512.1 hypothetical protein FNH07_19685 [Amycolatopsis bartoniae]GHF40984.1 hypothetical protein GCM10017566_13020 [Amycolatopsis bartoniae]